MRLSLIVLAALLLRLAALALAWNVECLLDECFYAELGTRLAAGEGFQSHARHYWPPGYVTFLGTHLHWGLGLGGAKITQVLLSTLLVPLVWLMARSAAAGAGRQDSEKVGLMAALLIAIHPTLIAYSHYLWSETLFLTLFSAGLLLVHAARHSDAGKLALPAGLLLGTACLVKVLPLYLVPVLAVWLFLGLGRRRGLIAAALLLAGTAAVITPWTVRNLVVHQRLVIIETTSGKNLVRGNNPVAPANWDWGTFRATRGVIGATGCDQDNLVDLNDCLAAYGISQILNHPVRFVSQAATKVADLVNPTSFLIRHIRRGLYGVWPASLAHGVVTLVALFHMAFMGLAVWGWCRTGGSWRQLTIMMVVYLIAIHVVTFAMSRFRLPLVPLLASGAALALVQPAAPTQARSRRNGILAAVLLCLLLAFWVTRVGDLYAPPPEAGPSGFSRGD